MKSLGFYTLLLLASIGCIWSCKSDSSDTYIKVVMDHKQLDKKVGDCDSTGNGCAKLSLMYPVVKEGNEALKISIQQWAEHFLVSQTYYGDQLDSTAHVTLDSAVHTYMAAYSQSIKEFPEMSLGWEVSVTDTILENSPKVLTVRMDAFSYTGGAHPNSFVIIGNFNPITGKEILLDSLILNKQGLTTLLEQKFRVEREEAFKEGFNFDEMSPFKIADNYGVTKTGLSFFYNPYEVGPYALGATQIDLTFAEIKDLIKVNLIH